MTLLNNKYLDVNIDKSIVLVLWVLRRSGPKLNAWRKRQVTRGRDARRFRVPWTTFTNSFLRFSDNTLSSLIALLLFLIPWTWILMKAIQTVCQVLTRKVWAAVRLGDVKEKKTETSESDWALKNLSKNVISECLIQLHQYNALNASSSM